MLRDENSRLPSLAHGPTRPVDAALDIVGISVRPRGHHHHRSPHRGPTHPVDNVPGHTLRYAPCLRRLRWPCLDPHVETSQTPVGHRWEYALTLAPTAWVLANADHNPRPSSTDAHFFVVDIPTLKCTPGGAAGAHLRFVEHAAREPVKLKRCMYSRGVGDNACLVDGHAAYSRHDIRVQDRKTSDWWNGGWVSFLEAVGTWSSVACLLSFTKYRHDA
ncbi:hypothetical protein FB45DRAFT_1064932 [Roridomyces roridus]|uniref:Uncharacterized protein n=1 Tax=Roridomyces roridus TaxID=1738132 RepID=A0AAD7B9R3_9AGAR|nr:hypothetical protein FB45DRAFT_1064932 [Roridomyces roridus]